MTIEPGPHAGFWIKDKDNKVVGWYHTKELAEQRLKEMQ